MSLARSAAAGRSFTLLSNFLPNPLLLPPLPFSAPSLLGLPLSLSLCLSLLTYYVVLQLQILQRLWPGEHLGRDARQLVAVEAQILKGGKKERERAKLACAH